MKKLVYVRAGQSGLGSEAEQLSDKGHRGAALLASALKNHLGDDTKPLLLSSPETRSWQSASYIATAFQVEVVTHEAFAKNKANEALRKLIEIADNYQLVIIVGHNYEVDGVPVAYASEVLRKELIAGEAGYGEANILDCETGTIELFKP